MQLPTDAVDDAGGATALERALSKALGDDVYFDGRDEGATQTSLFMFTADPADIFERAREVLEEWELLEYATVAKRESDSDTYAVIWPPDFRGTFSSVR